MGSEKTQRVAQFFAMVMADLELTSEGDLDPEQVLIPFMGSGASDNLRIKDVCGFLEEQGAVAKE